MKTIFIGPIGKEKHLTNGANVKNYHLVKALQQYDVNPTIVDTNNWKRNPLILVNLITTIIINPKAKYILSLNSSSANKVIRILNKLAPDCQIIYWVIGGSFAKRLRGKEWDVTSYKTIDKIIVEGESMKRDLIDCGLTNIAVIPNFKNLVRIENHQKTKSTRLKFVFLSRIIPEKGCDLIIDACKILNQNNYENRYTVDFYGPIEDSYKDSFFEKINNLDNLKYNGFLNLRETSNYEKLGSYDAMLFPTYWPGEGCPGIVIDAYIAGLPILASDWNLNQDYVEDHITGILFNAKDVTALLDNMKSVIDYPDQLVKFKHNIPDILSKFDINEVLSKKNLHIHGII